VIATAFALVVVGVWLLLGSVSIRTTDTR